MARRSAPAVTPRPEPSSRPQGRTAGRLLQVYGDQSRRADAGDELAAVVGGWDALGQEQPGLAWHGRCVALLIRLGGLLQGVADRDFARDGWDEP